jgi:hypothetical protein
VDALCQARRQLGLPSLGIQWGPIADVGFVAEIMKVPFLLLSPSGQKCDMAADGSDPSSSALAAV